MYRRMSFYLSVFKDFAQAIFYFRTSAMITPRFRLTQNNEHLIVRIHAPLAHLEDTDYVVEGRIFMFTAKPYYLRFD